MKTFLVRCWSFCRQITVRLKVESGDADLYAKEREPPKIENSNCADCPLCKSRDPDLEDSCYGISTFRNNKFFVTVTAHKRYTGATITFAGHNLKNVTIYKDDSEMTRRELLATLG